MRLALLLTPATILLLLPPAGRTSEKELAITLRSRVDDNGTFRVVTKEQQWPAHQTAIIVCDMWDAHHCLNAVRREEEIVPRMNEGLEKARSRGVFVMRAASGCMEPY